MLRKVRLVGGRIDQPPHSSRGQYLIPFVVLYIVCWLCSPRSAGGGLVVAGLLCHLPRPMPTEQKLDAVAAITAKPSHAQLDKNSANFVAIDDCPRSGAGPGSRTRRLHSSPLRPLVPPPFPESLPSERFASRNHPPLPSPPRSHGTIRGRELETWRAACSVAP